MKPLRREGNSFPKCIIKGELVNGQVIIYFRLLNVFIVNNFSIYKVVDFHAPGKRITMIHPIRFDFGQNFLYLIGVCILLGVRIVVSYEQKLVCYPNSSSYLLPESRQ